MKITSIASLLCVSMFSTIAVVSADSADERIVTPEIDSVGLFKNGVVIVRASFPIDGPGVYRWEDVPSPNHGTFQVNTRAAVRTTATRRHVEVTPENEPATGHLQQDLAGKNVRVRMKASANPGMVVTGTVWEVPQPSQDAMWNRTYQSVDGGARHGWPRMLGADPRMARAHGGVPAVRLDAGGGGFLVLENDGGREYVDLDSVAAISVEGPFAPRPHSEERPVLLFDVGEAETGDRVNLFYLTKGMAWMPSYTVEIGEERLQMRQTALVRNELMDLNGAVAGLISGFPNIRFGHVDSPLAPGASLSGFFAQALHMPGRGGSVASQRAITSQSITFNVAPPEPIQDLPDGSVDGVDMHFLDIGSLRLATGDSLALEVAKAEAEFERVVEWKAEDRRDAFGRFRSQQDETGPEPWDALRLRNPFDFPITTAPVQFLEDGNFRGQGQTHFINPGQRMNLPVNKALSVTVHHHEVEEEMERNHVRIGGSNYQRSRVSGTLEVFNHRKDAVTVIAGVEFSGTVGEVNGDPQMRLRTEGVWGVNPRREIEWRMEIDAGGSSKVEYSYEVLVRR